jgi:hypothetical protein
MKAAPKLSRLTSARHQCDGHQDVKAVLRSGHRQRAESAPPKRSFEAFTRLCLSPLVTDRAMEAWYHPSIA